MKKHIFAVTWSDPNRITAIIIKAPSVMIAWLLIGTHLWDMSENDYVINVQYSGETK